MMFLRTRIFKAVFLLLGTLFAEFSVQAQALVSPSSIWTQDSVLGIANGAGDEFGAAVTTADFNGDGFDDMAVGTPNVDAEGVTDSGAVFVFYGTAGGLDASANEIIWQGMIENSFSEVNDRFGWALAAGDFNADGFDDLVVGTPYEDLGTDLPDTGAVTVLFGSAAGLIPVQAEFFSQTTLPISFNEPNDLFGWSLAVGDINNDGFDDLAIGVPLEDLDLMTDVGMIGVLFGSVQGLLPAVSQVISQDSVLNAFNESGDQFGRSLAAGDFNEDGYADIAVGVPFEDAGGVSDIGQVMVLFGTRTGLAPGVAEVFSEASLSGGASEASDLFGWSLAAGDFDSDGHDDLAIGVPFEDVGSREDTGAIAIFYGSNDGLLPSVSETFDQTDVDDGRNSSNDNAGYSLAAGDFDGDGSDDLLIGVLSDNFSGIVSNGSAMVVFGAASGMALDRSFFLGQSHFGGTEEAGDEFGAVIAVGDFNANGIADMVVGTPNEDLLGALQGGAVYVGELADSDGDGLTDVAEEGVFETDPLRVDTDGDGVDDGVELMAGTSPLNSASVVKVVSVTSNAPSGMVTISFSSVTGRRYRVERSSVLEGEPWLDLTAGNPVFAGGETATFFDQSVPVGVERLFYRVVALPDEE